MPVSTVMALGNQGYFTGPSGGVSKPGDQFVVSVDGSVGPSWAGTGSVSGSITFPANLLKVVSINTSGATFSATGSVPYDNTAGTITFNQGAAWHARANNQTVHFFSITFQSLRDGVANVNFQSLRYDNVTGASTTGGTYRIVTPPAPSPTPKPSPSTPPKTTAPPKTSTPPKTTSPTPVATEPPAPTVEETPAPTSSSDGGLRIENVKTTITRKESALSWSVNNPDATVTMLYGTKKGSLVEQAKLEKQEDGTYKTSLTGLKLGSLYYFVVKASTADDLQGATYNGSFTTRGYPVQLTIQQNGLLLPEAKVAIGDRQFTANKNALVTTELGDGTYTASITPAGSSSPYTVTFAVAKKTIPSSGNPDTQNILLNTIITGKSSGLSGSLLVPIIGGVAALVALVGGVIGFIAYRRRKAQDMPETIIDADLLNTSYGQEVQGYRDNTPEPQLDSGNFGPNPLPAVAQDDPIIAIPEPQLVVPSTIEDTPATTEINDTPVAYQALDPSQLPLPPQDMPTDAIPATSPQAEASYADTEQISPEISAIESTEVAEEEPSAVYDASTGELDIVHHSHHPAASPPQSTIIAPQQ